MTDTSGSEPAPEPSPAPTPPPPPPATTPARTAGPVGKVRSPIVVILLFIVTLGIYGIYWWYASFQELKDHTGEGIGGLLGILFGVCIGIVGIFLLPFEIGNMYEREGKPKPMSWLTGFWNFLPLVGGIIWVFKVQDAMNREWESH
jgi:hypothetical protein